ncbi:TIGR01459 family HAD-type hydrolase [Limimaricola hongkongensis]|uniref:HAD superfamily protein involved in N-acetyl-glucosamine catabolism n=1 Tax=Limimaricola hongkongensis DSM 17492 TaxID=1122180 RepID=A0A017HDU2_9RHOB|nr:TIGR01459 family HAD-type hydrolase [Limimaricola hongkongensis]EYD72667.1 HAD superfamily protein involved in N-acetyl-glucosamine catabolism [Limimaricola hongkongensis DSM 17492]
MTRIIDRFADIMGGYDAAFVDLWGCMHNGVRAYEDAVAAMRGFRAAGGKVILVTNSPRPRASVERQVEGLGVPRDCYDSVASSGDSARAAMFTGAVGSKVWFIGDERDEAFFEPLKIIKDPVAIERTDLDRAEGIVCCGPEDEHADPELYRPQFERAVENGLKLLCANPDIVVDRGEERVWCAGALAKLYTEMGGTSLYFGKPHPPIYDLARRRLAEIDAGIADDRIICIGDGPHTDVSGAAGEDLDCLFITGGLAAGETATAPGGQPDAGKLDAYLKDEGQAPAYSIGFLR